jgi:hypothetical protein
MKHISVVYKTIFACLLVLAFTFHSSKACLILCLKDDQRTIIGNHEDWFKDNAAIKVNAPNENRFGSLIFTFQDEKWAQGGINDQGLFFDVAYTPYQEINHLPERTHFDGYIWQEVLDKCSTVEDALKLLSHYQLPDLEEAHVFLADSTGGAIIIGVKDGNIEVKSIKESYLLQTNFNPWQPELSEEPKCWRYGKAEELILENDMASVANMKKILANTHQEELTVYSNIYDLKARRIYTYYKRDFENPLIIDLDKVLQYDQCLYSLEELVRGELEITQCQFTHRHGEIAIKGEVKKAQTNEPIPYVNIGILNKNVGTLSDPDGSFEIKIPLAFKNEEITVSSIGYETETFKIMEMDMLYKLELKPKAQILEEVKVYSKKARLKRERLGWMKGREGVLPFDTIMGGGTVAILLDPSENVFFIDKLQVRLMYNSKDTATFRLHFYEWDSLGNKPGKELLKREIILRKAKRFGWLNFDLSYYDLVFDNKSIVVGFEWLEDRKQRDSLLIGLKEWSNWKERQYLLGNKKVEMVVKNDSTHYFKYHGNMMNWPGFKSLPPFTGLMVDDKRTSNNKEYRTFERKTSHGQWVELQSTLNAVLTVSYFKE